METWTKNARPSNRRSPSNDSVLSLIPFFAPMVMFTHIHVLTPPAWQIAASIGLLVVTTGLIVLLAARIFRAGILMYGKRASLPEVWRWMRYR